MDVTGVDFIILPTQDYDRAAAFYGDVLGLEFGKRWGEMPAGEFETGSLTIALMEPGSFGMEFAPHAFPVVLHVEDVKATRAELEGKGIEFIGDGIDSGVCLMEYFKDPDGNALMLHHRYAPKGAKPGEAS